MGDTGSPGMWAALGCLVGVVLLSGVALWGAWRRGMRAPRHSPPPTVGKGPSFTRGWEQEDEQLAELARRADELREKQQ